MAMDESGLMEALDQGWAEISPEYASSPDRQTVKEKMLLGLARGIVNYLHSNGEVSFSAGQIVGVDAPGGDTHDTLTAAGGSIV